MNPNLLADPIGDLTDCSGETAELAAATPCAEGKGSANRRKPGAKIGHVRILPFNAIRPSPENDELYRPIDPGDPEIVSLANSVRERGILEPIVITTDNWIVSGHRRYAAAKLAGLQSLPCRVAPLSREDDRDRFLSALREYNRQREKSFDEKVRETVVSLNPDEAYQALISERKERSAVEVEALQLRGEKARARITDAKTPFLDAINQILATFKGYWPLSERFIHYKLLNDPPLTHASKPNSAYRNEKRFSKMLSELATRARIAGDIPEEAIEDETRPVTVWQCFPEPGAFVQQQLDGLLKGYWRDLMQSQPNHIELLVEKNTAANILRHVAAPYCIPMTSGRGFSSLPPRIAMRKRFEASGKDKLVVVICSDFDPDGDEIAHSFARSMRDDYDLSDIVAIKAGLTLAQVQEHELPSAVEAKQSSTNYRRFAAKYGAAQNAYELEALPPELLQQITREAIDAVIDRELFNQELAQEKQDAAHIQGLRQEVTKLLGKYRRAA